jgi:hypothetical protein
MVEPTAAGRRDPASAPVLGPSGGSLVHNWFTAAPRRRSQRPALGQVFNTWPRPFQSLSRAAWQAVPAGAYTERVGKVEPHPDRQLYAEQCAWATRRFVDHLPPGDPLRASLLTAAEASEARWAMVLDQHQDGSTTIRHPPDGPTIKYDPLERLYRVPYDDPPRVVVAQAGGHEPDERLDAASVYIGGESVASMIGGDPDSGCAEGPANRAWPPPRVVESYETQR